MTPVRRHARVLCLLAATVLAACSDVSSPTAAPTGELAEMPIFAATVSAFDSALTARVGAPDAMARLTEVDVTLTLSAPYLAVPVDIVQVMDASGSVESWGWTQEKAFVKAIALAAPASSKLGLVQFSDDSYIKATLNQNLTRAQYNTIVDGLPFLNGYTATMAGVRDAIEIFEDASQQGRGKVMLLITDGNPNPSTQNPCGTSSTAVNTRQRLAAQGIRTILVTVGPSINAGTLSCLYNNDPTRVVSAASFDADDLNAILDDVLALVSPKTEDVVLEGTLGSNFERVSGPTKTDAVVVPPGTDSFSWNPATRGFRWKVSEMTGPDRTAKLRVRAGPTACGVQTLSSGVTASWIKGGIADNSALPSLTINVTGCTAPSVGPTVAGTLGTNGWYRSDVSVSWSVVSQLPVTQVGCAPETVTADTPGTMFRCLATSSIGFDQDSVLVRRDATPPTLTVTGNQGVYHAGETIQLVCQAEDATSGILGVSCPPALPASEFPAGTHELLAIAMDNAGNGIEVLTPFEVILDVTPPVIVPSVAGDLGDNGWYRSTATLTWAVTDVESEVGAVSGCSQFVLDDDHPSVTITCEATSAGGTASESITLKRDTNVPELTILGNDGVYQWGETVDILCGAEDALSGVALVNCPTPAAATDFAAGMHTLTATAVDNAGNTGSIEYSFEIIADVTPPVIAPQVTGTLGAGGWYTSDVSVSWSVSDAESALSSQAGCGPTTVSADTNGVTFTCEAASAGGAASQSVTIQRDATIPAVAFAGNLGTYGAADVVAITCSATDATSGIATSSCPAVSGPAWSFGVGGETRTASATDHAGNSTSTFLTFTVTVDVDDVETIVQTAVTGPGAAGIRTSLMAKLRGPKPNVKAFVNQVNAQIGKSITPEMAAVLIALAEAIP